MDTDEPNLTAAGAPKSASSRRRCVVVLDDELAIQRLLRVILEGEGYDVVTTDDGHKVLELAAQQQLDLIIQDLRMPKMDGLTFLKQLKQKHPDIPSIVVTAFGTFESAIEAMRLGAYTHLNKPFDTEEMRQTVSRALERLEFSKKSPRAGVAFLDMISQTPSMAAISSLINRVARTDSTVLITGESGTGKELVARSIHYNSLRSDQPFVAVNCGAFTETLLESELFGHVKGSFTNAIADRKGVFESADRGTLFLDEVGELSLTTQVKLLRVLETRTFKPVGGAKDMRVDVRFITATNRNLPEMVSEGQFREDLFYRLNVIPIELPPLRDRKEDIPLLAGHFLARFAKRMNKPMQSIDDSAIEALLKYSWPGNVRELENTIERAVALSIGDKITAADLAGPIRGHASARMAPLSSSSLRPPASTSNSGLTSPASASGSALRTAASASGSALRPAASASGSALAATTHPGPVLINSPFGAHKSEARLPAAGMDLEQWLLERERAYIIQALERTNWNLTEAAKLLNMTFRSIRYRVAKLNIERPTRSESEL
ncbi:MAG TPA: sigma-54 dependent transcriptional regulator [Planctomycetota bacterium]|nr:sigma-54 dependent transcriptional regulator [Planctomycetota bacterium]